MTKSAKNTKSAKKAKNTPAAALNPQQEIINRGYIAKKVDNTIKNKGGEGGFTYDICRSPEGNFVQSSSGMQSKFLPIRWVYEVARKCAAIHGDKGLSIELTDQLVATAKSNTGTGNKRNPLESYANDKAKLEGQKDRYEAKLKEINEKIANLVEPVIEEVQEDTKATKPEKKEPTKKTPNKKSSSKKATSV